MTIAMGRGYVELSLLWVAGVLCGCAPHGAEEKAGEVVEVVEAEAAALEAETPERAASAEEEPAVAVTEPESEPEEVESEVEPPTSKPVVVTEAVSVRPHVRVWFEDLGEDMGCEGFVEARGFPAYDPNSEQVVVLETYARKMSSEREATLLWYDANTGKAAREESLIGGEGDMSCKKATRRARRHSREVNRSLRKVAWESMSPVPLRRIHEDEYANFREPLGPDATDEDREEHAEWGAAIMPRGQIHVVERAEGTVVRLPGVKVYEREVDIFPNTLSRLVGHRPSGVVAAVHADCRDEEDCTCNLEESTHVMRWSPETLAAIDANPCVVAESGEDDFACVLGSIFDG